MASVTGFGAKALDGCAVDAVDVHAFEIPTDGPGGREQDGTLEWDSTTVVPVYGSGGFTNYPLDRLAGQLTGWVEWASGG